MVELTILCGAQYTLPMRAKTEIAPLQEKLVLELRRGTVVLAVLSQLGSPAYGYSLLQRLADRGLEIDQGSLYPLLRRLDEQGLLSSEWNVEGSRPRKYYRLSLTGELVFSGLSNEWRGMVEVLDGLLTEAEGE